MTEWRHRVHFQETDGMRVVYHGNYLNWLEATRVEYLRSCGITLSDLMARGIVFPIVDVHVKYLAPAYFDDEIIVRAYLTEASRAKIVFAYEIVREADGMQLVAATSVGTFTSMETGRIVRLPQDLATPLCEMAAEDGKGYHG